MERENAEGVWEDEDTPGPFSRDHLSGRGQS